MLIFKTVEASQYSHLINKTGYKLVDKLKVDLSAKVAHIGVQLIY